MTDVATLPVGAHLSILKRFIERERSMRIRVLKGENQRKGITDADQAMDSLRVVAAALGKEVG